MRFGRPRRPSGIVSIALRSVGSRFGAREGLDLAGAEEAEGAIEDAGAELSQGTETAARERATNRDGSGAVATQEPVTGEGLRGPGCEGGGVRVAPGRPQAARRRSSGRGAGAILMASSLRQRPTFSSAMCKASSAR